MPTYLPDSDQKEKRGNSHRYSQVAFIDGDRGTGKTSVLLTIRHVCSICELPKTISPEVKQLHENQACFEWLETLDMEPLRRDSNLFGAILARLEAVLGNSLKPRNAISGVLDDLDAHEKYLADLTALQNDVVLAWDFNTSKRGEHLDPHAYAAEVLRAERASLQLNTRMTKLLESLSNWRRTAYHQKDTVFVLPVDDFDLAPIRCLELLRLIRSISTPKLFFLICGNSRLAQTALTLKNEGELCELVSGIAFRNDEWNTLIRPTANEVAANNLRKLLPPQQRVSRSA